MIFEITGIKKNDKRFKPIKTITPQHYNIWKGTIWIIGIDEKRKVFKRINW
jgi:hypothetical protein